MRTSHETLSKILFNLSDPQCVHVDQMIVLKGQLPGSKVYIKIGVSGECLLPNETAAYSICSNLDEGTRILCPLIVAYAPWLKVSNVRADRAMRTTIAPFIVNLADKSYIDIMVIRSCGTTTMADYIASNATPMQISMMMCRCGDQIRRMNLLGVYHQDMHTRNVVICEMYDDEKQVPCVIDFEFALTGATPNTSLKLFDKEFVADNIRTKPNPRCDLHKFAYDVWTRTGSPTNGMIFTTVHAMMGCTPIGTTHSLKTIPILETNCAQSTQRGDQSSSTSIHSNNIWRSADSYTVSGITESVPHGI